MMDDRLHIIADGFDGEILTIDLSSLDEVSTPPTEGTFIDLKTIASSPASLILSTSFFDPTSSASS
jgi:hypothetical protein